MIAEYFGSCSEALMSPASPTLKIFAVKAIKGFLETASKEVVVVYIEKIILGLLNLVAQSKDDTLILVLETLTSALTKDAHASARCENFITPVICNIWMSIGHGNY